MNPRRGWNPDLEESYLQEYSESESKIFTQGTSGFYLWPMKILSHKSLQSRYIENVPKLISFSILGFFSPGVKLGFDFPGFLLKQKI